MKFITACSAVVTALLLTSSAAESEPTEPKSATLQKVPKPPSSTLTPSSSSPSVPNLHCAITRHKLDGYIKAGVNNMTSFNIERVELYGDGAVTPNKKPEEGQSNSPLCFQHRSLEFCFREKKFCDDSVLFNHAVFPSRRAIGRIMESLESIFGRGNDDDDDDDDDEPIVVIPGPPGEDPENPGNSAGKFGVRKILLMLVVPVFLALW